MTLLVDNRERAVIEELTQRNVPHQVMTLDVGDFHIVSDDGTVIGIWERKTYTDLAASLSDKRYAEQKCRLLSTAANYRGYILEGNCPKGQYRGLHPGTIDSIRIGLMCRDNFKVLSSDGLSHTVTILEKLVKKLPEYLSQEHISNAERYRNALVDSSVSAIKKENLTPELCYLSQLSQIPQISYISAKTIQSRYPNMSALITAINTDRLATVSTISNLKVTERRLGDSIANKVCDYLVPTRVKIAINLKTPTMSECLI